MLLLQREAVAERAPRLRRQAVRGDALLRQVRQPRVALQVPQDGGVHLARLEPRRVDAPRALERARALLVLHHLRVRLPQQAQGVPGVALTRVQTRERRHALGAAEHREVRRGVRQRRQQRARRERALREPPGRKQDGIGDPRRGISPGISPGRKRKRLGELSAAVLGGATRTRLAVQRLAAAVLAARRAARAAPAAAHRGRGGSFGVARLVPPRVRGGHEPRTGGSLRRAEKARGGARDGRQPRAAAHARRELLLRRGVREEAPRDLAQLAFVHEHAPRAAPAVPVRPGARARAGKSRTRALPGERRRGLSLKLALPGEPRGGGAPFPDGRGRRRRVRRRRRLQIVLSPESCARGGARWPGA